MTGIWSTFLKINGVYFSGEVFVEAKRLEELGLCVVEQQDATF